MTTRGTTLVRPGSRDRRAHAALAVLPLAAVGGLVLWQLRPSGEATAPPATASTVAAPAATVPTSRQQLQQAQAAVSFPLQLPDAIDGWFPLVRVQVAGATTGAERVTLWYTGNGGYLRVVQGPGVAPELAVLAEWPAAEHGETTVQGRPATWLQGTLVPTAGGMRAWRPGPLRLYWTTAAGTGYLLESDFYAPDQLARLAATVAPCSPATPADRERPSVRPHPPAC